MTPEQTAPATSFPSVSIIVPCYNEQETICKLLEAIHCQTYPQEQMEVVIADGMSTDSTRAAIAGFAGTHPDLSIRVVDNPRKVIPAALNCALAQAKGEVIVRLDGHSMPHVDYVERSVTDLQTGLGENVGGVWEIMPGAKTWMAESIAAAASNPIGVGDALYRHAAKAAAVDTVPFGAFKRELLALVGFFDESLLTNEDYEFNTRIRRTGGKIWLDPSIRSIYVARANLAALAKQYARYGFWKWRMLRRYPKTVRYRQALPPLFVLSIILGTILAVFSSFFRAALAVEAAAYLLVLLITGAGAAVRARKPYFIAGVPLAIMTMHFAWGGAFLWSIISSIFAKRS